jgi:hypothetical protein
MQHDNALKKALKMSAPPSLPSGFDDRTMLRIYQAVEKKRKRTIVLMYSLLSVTSIALISLAVFLIHRYFAPNFSFELRIPQFSLESSPLYSFCVYIAVLILVLAGLDLLFRSYWHRRKL